MNKIRRTSIFSTLLLSFFAFIMVFPLVWLVFASFKDNTELFTSLSVLPKTLKFDAYVSGWTKSGKVPFSQFYLNSIRLVLGVTIGSLISCSLVAYGFSRFKFPLRKFLFFVMLSGLMIPGAVLVIPRFMLFKQLGWINTYKPFIVPAFFANQVFFVFMFFQFFRTIPIEYDESAYLDGAGSFRIFWNIIMPLSKPAIASACIFLFIWTWNDFFGPLIYINSVKNYTVSLGLKMTLDATTSVVNWNQIIAMAVMAMLPSMIVYLIAQKQFVQGITTTGLKG
jgi:oligogalacturonide transport system permease protein